MEVLLYFDDDEDPVRRALAPGDWRQLDGAQQPIRIESIPVLSISFNETTENGSTEDSVGFWEGDQAEALSELISNGTSCQSGSSGGSSQRRLSTAPCLSIDNVAACTGFEALVTQAPSTSPSESAVPSADPSRYPTGKPSGVPSKSSMPSGISPSFNPSISFSPTPPQPSAKPSVVSPFHLVFMYELLLPMDP